MRRRLTSVLVLAVMSGAACAQDGPRATHTLVDPARGYADVAVLRLEGGDLVHAGIAGRERRVPIEALAALTPLDRVRASVSPDRERGVVAIELVDGTSSPGVLVTGDDPDAIVADLPGLGARSIALERLAVVRFAEGHDAAVALRSVSSERAGEDRVLLTNGDVLGGFVLTIDGEGVQIETDGRVQSLGVDLVSGVVLANPAEPAVYPLVGLRDGRVLALTAAEGTLSIAPERVRATDLAWIASSASRVTAIAGLAGEVTQPGPRRRWVPGARVRSPETSPGGLGEIVLRGPQTWSVPLPAWSAGGQSGGRVGLRLSVPASDWSDLRVRVRTGGDVLADLTLSGRGERSRDLLVDVPPGARSIEFEVGEGRYGPVRDELRIALGFLAPAE